MLNFRGIYKLHPWSLTWNLRIHPWKRKIIFQTIIFKFYVKLQGHIQITPLKFNMEPENTPLEKENHLPVPIIFKFYVKLQGHIQITPLKFNMEPENTPLEKENHLPVPIIFKFYVKLQGHIQIIRHDKTRQTPPPWPRPCRVQHPTWRDHQRSTWRNSEKQRRGNPRKTKFPKDSFYDWMIFFLFGNINQEKCSWKMRRRKSLMN